jgi:glycosyltransferase involved in cell wall biosynthesis
MIMNIISVIIPAHNEERFIKKSIESILKQTYYPIEIIVVADNCTDKTYEIAKDTLKDYKFSKVFKGKYGSAAKTRNAGAWISTGEILIFHDADCIADKNMALNVSKKIFDKGYDGVSTKTITANQNGLIPRIIDVERALRWETNQSTETKIESGKNTLVANISRNAFTKIGGFNESIFYFEDEDLTKRFFEAGFKAVFDPSVIEYHYDPSTIGEQISQSLANGKGLRTIVFGQKKFSKLLLPIYPFAFLGGLIALFFGNIILGVILLAPIFFIYLIGLSKSDDLAACVILPFLVLFRNFFKFIGLIKVW